MDTVRLYNTFPAEDDAYYAEAVRIAWHDFLCRQGASSWLTPPPIPPRSPGKASTGGTSSWATARNMMFSAPPDAYGHEGVLTPEDAFVAAANTCVSLRRSWAVERFRIDLVSFTCRTDGVKKIELDRTEIFTHLTFYPEIAVRPAAGEDVMTTEKRAACPGLGPEVQPG